VQASASLVPPFLRAGGTKISARLPKDWFLEIAFVCDVQGSTTT